MADTTEHSPHDRFNHKIDGWLKQIDTCLDLWGDTKALDSWNSDHERCG